MRRHLTTFVCAVALLVVARTTQAQSCCGKLDVPLAGTERAANKGGQLLVGVSYELGVSHNGYIEQGFGIDSARTNTLTLDASYGITSWLTPSIAVPFAYKSYSALVDGREHSRNTVGVGDALVLVKLGLIGQRLDALIHLEGNECGQPEPGQPPPPWHPQTLAIPQALRRDSRT